MLSALGSFLRESAYERGLAGATRWWEAVGLLYIYHSHRACSAVVPSKRFAGSSVKPF